MSTRVAAQMSCLPPWTMTRRGRMWAADVVGHSDGAFVARHRPDLVKPLVRSVAGPSKNADAISDVSAISAR